MPDNVEGRALMYRNEKPRFDDILNEDKSTIAKMNNWQNLHHMRTIIREHRETIHGLRKRLDKMEYQLTAIMFEIQVLKERESNANREKIEK